jgi:O-antigen ligase
MWGILLRDVFPQNSWFGQGFGTTWADLDFRLQMRDVTGWAFPLLIADNGFLDILLNLGIVGLVLFLLNYMKMWIDSGRYFLWELSLESFFPFIFMVYTFFANLTFSLFMEAEVFVWMLIVTLMIIVTQKNNRSLA